MYVCSHSLFLSAIRFGPTRLDTFVCDTLLHTLQHALQHISKMLNALQHTITCVPTRLDTFCLCSYNTHVSNFFFEKNIYIYSQDEMRLVYLFICIYVSMFVHVCLNMHFCMCVCMHACACVRMCVWLCVSFNLSKPYSLNSSSLKPIH